MTFLRQGRVRLGGQVGVVALAALIGSAAASGQKTPPKDDAAGKSAKQDAPAAASPAAAPAPAAPAPAAPDPAAPPAPVAPLTPAEIRDAGFAADTARLLQLAKELKAEVDKSNKDTLSVAVIKKATQVELLARDLKERMKAEEGSKPR